MDDVPYGAANGSAKKRRTVPEESLSSASGSAGDHAGGIPMDSVVVYFDLETTGLSLLTCEILQIAAKAGNKMFNKFVLPAGDIDKDASAVNGFKKSNGRLYQRGVLVRTSRLRDVLSDFIDFLGNVGGRKSVVLAAHNGNRYDVFILLRELKQHNLLQPFLKTVVGFVDTLHVMKTQLSGTTSDYKLTSLAKYFNINTDDSHDALGDARILEKLIQAAKITNTFLITKFAKTSAQVAFGGRFTLWSGKEIIYGLLKLAEYVTENMLRKLAENVITLEMLQMASSDAEEFENLLVPLHLSNVDHSNLLDAVLKPMAH